MNRRDLWRRLAQRLRNARFEDVDQLLRLAGWDLNHVRGSHHVYPPDGRHVSIPRHRTTVKPAYVKLVLEETKEPGDE